MLHRVLSSILVAGSVAGLAIAGCSQGPDAGSDSAAAKQKGSETACCPVAKQKIKVTQNGTTVKVKPITGAESIVDYYSYGIPNAASADTGLEQSDNSLLYFYADTDNCTLNLVIIHDAVQDGTGGQVVFNLSGLPVTSTLAVGDEPGELASFAAPASTLTWNWFPCCTDGAAIDGFDGDFAVTIDPSFLDGVTTWKLLSQDKNGLSETVLDMSAPVTLSKGGDDDSSSDDSSSDDSSSDDDSCDDSSSDDSSSDDSSSDDSSSDDSSSDDSSSDDSSSDDSSDSSSDDSSDSSSDDTPPPGDETPVDPPGEVL